MKFLHCHGYDCKSAALLVLRIAAGIIFIYHGYGKLFGDIGMANFTGMVDGLGFPAPAFFAWCAALSEFVGGIALILGAFTTVAGVLTAITMLVAFIGVKNSAIPAGDADLALLAISAALAMMGAGKWSVDALICKKWCVGKGKTEAKGCCDGGACKM